MSINFMLAQETEEKYTRGEIVLNEERTTLKDLARARVKEGLAYFMNQNNIVGDEIDFIPKRNPILVLEGGEIHKNPKEVKKVRKFKKKWYGRFLWDWFGEEYLREFYLSKNYVDQIQELAEQDKKNNLLDKKLIIFPSRTEFKVSLQQLLGILPKEYINNIRDVYLGKTNSLKNTENILSLKNNCLIRAFGGLAFEDYHEIAEYSKKFILDEILMREQCPEVRFIFSTFKEWAIPYALNLNMTGSLLLFKESPIEHVLRMEGPSFYFTLPDKKYVDKKKPFARLTFSHYGAWFSTKQP